MLHNLLQMNTRMSQIGLSNMLGGASTPPGDNATPSSPLLDFKEPEKIEYEQKINAAKNTWIEQDVPKEIFLFPENNVQVVEKARELPQGVAPLPEDYQDPKLESYVKETFRYFSQKSVEVQHNHKKYEKVIIDDTQFSRQKFEYDVKQGKKKENESVNDVEVDMSLLKPAIPETKKLIQKKVEGRLFKIFDMHTSEQEYDWAGGAEANICKRIKEEKKMALKVTEPLLVELVKFETKIAQKTGSEVEPLFISMALYDVKSKKKISETFHVDQNAEEFNTLLPQTKNADPSNTLKRAVFHVSERSPNIFMLIRVSKIVQGDDDAIVEPYMKADKIKEAEAKKLKTAITPFCQKLGHYKQQICWAYVPVFDESDDSVMIPKEFSQFYKYKGSMSDNTYMTLFGTGSQSKKLKSFPASIQLKVTELTDYSPVYKGNGTVLVHEENEKGEKIPVLAKDILEFPVDVPLEFNNYSTNYLYVNPETVNLNSRQLTGKTSRNVCVKVQLKSGDNCLDDDGLSLIHGGSTEPLFNNAAYTDISYHNRHPEFHDEFKIKLPTHITSDHHLLFTFYHVVCKFKTGKSNQILIGYAYVPLLDGKGGTLINGKKTLPVIQEFGKPTAYLNEESRRNAKYIDSGKGLFQIGFNAVSTLYPHDPNVTQFYKVLPLLEKEGAATQNVQDVEGTIVNGINALSKALPVLIIQNMPMIFNELLRIVCCRTYKKAQKAAFKTLLDLFDIVSITESQKTEQTSARNELLQKYVTEIFNNSIGSECLVYEELPAQFLSLLEEAQVNRRIPGFQESQRNIQSKYNKLLFEYSWVLFDLIHKSLILTLDANKKLNEQDRSVGSPIKREAVDVIQRLVGELSQEIVYLSGAGYSLGKVLNPNLALFVRDLFDVLDRGIVLAMISQFLFILKTDTRNTETLHEWKTVFLNIITDHEHYVPLSAPVDSELDEKIKSGAALHELFNLFFLGGIITDDLKDDITHKEKTIRHRALTSIKTLLTKHEYDSRYQEEKYLQKISAIYFPLIVYMTENFDTFKHFSEEKSKDYRSKEKTYKQELTDIEDRIKELQKTNDDKKEGDIKINNDDELNRLKEEEAKARKKWEAAAKLADEEARRCKHEQQLALLIYLFVVKNIKRDILINWWKKQSSVILQKFIEIMSFALDLFEYSGKREITERGKVGAEVSTTSSLSDAKSALESMYTSLEKRTNIRASTASVGAAGGRKKGTLTRNFRVHRQTANKAGNNSTASQSQLSGESKEIVKRMVLWEGNISTEVSIIVLHVLTDFFVNLEKEILGSSILTSLKSQSSLFDTMFGLLTKFLETKQSEKTLYCAFTVLIQFVIQYKTVLFAKNTPYSETLCSQFLTYSYCRFDKIRTLSTASLYNMIRSNYSQAGNFTRVKILTTVALSKLVTTLDDKSIALLRSSFKAITAYAESDKIRTSFVQEAAKAYLQKTQSVGERKGVFEKMKKEEAEDFPTQVKNLIERLGKALMDTIEIKELEKTTNDCEIMADLYIRIANSYRHAPELSATWYDNLAAYHYQNKKYIEAAQCVIYMAAMVYHYLHMHGFSSMKAINYNHFTTVAPFLKKEQFEELKSLFDEAEKPSFQSHDFTEAGFIGLVERAINYMNEDGYFEFAVQLYKLLIEYYEGLKHYDRLRICHEKMAEFYGLIHRANQKSTRLFGSYYKVAFFGKKFSEDLKDKQFVYKMPKITRLAEIVEYLQGIFNKKYGEENVKIVGDSFNITPQARAEDVAYIQITSVKPQFKPAHCSTTPSATSGAVSTGVNVASTALTYSTPYQPTAFELHSCLGDFFFETPFTKTGKAHGGLIDQYKRKTIVTLKSPFPFVKTRIEIESKTEKELTPVENAVELLEGSLLKLETEASRDPPNINNLQMVLQGTVIPTVNEGIPQVVRTFLGVEKPEAKFGSDHIEKMKNYLRLFVKLANRAIQISNKVCSQEQRPLQAQFSKGLDSLVEMFKQFIPNIAESMMTREE